MQRMPKVGETNPIGAELTAGYQPYSGFFDEMMDAGTGIRSHWAKFLDHMGQLSPQELAASWETARRLVQENGVTYNVHSEAGDKARPWRMDPVPLLIEPGEWRQLETGLIQRARLLNRIVADIYGERKLLAANQVPAPLILGNPSFLRPLDGIQPPGGVHLNFMAFDIARAADHRWWILNDRTQAPSGSGYALENRIVMARSLPEVFRDAQVQRLAGFFQGFSGHLIEQTGKDDPLIVLMTPGPYNETYFEHAYLARYLGFPLVEGADLTVRDNKVFLKTLNGLKQVNMILRRVDADYCDPLELRTDSELGVAGLVAAIRAGNVLVANGLGSGVIECEALMSFLPGLCRSLLGEDLMLPSLATWWCGQEAERDYVIANLDRLILRPTFSNSSIISKARQDIHPERMSATERAALVERLKSRGFEYFGQESLALSTTPCWVDGHLEPRAVVLRVYVAADGDSYRVMPGGLARTSDEPAPQSISMQQGDASKDTWVLSDSPVSVFSRLGPPDQALAFRRSGDDLTSRVADNLFWLGRYAERAESSVRLLRSMILRIAGEAGAGDDPATLTRLTNILVDLGYIRQRSARKAAAGGILAVEREIAALLFERGSQNGLLELLGNLKRTASMVRDRLSVDSWRILNLLHRSAETHTSVMRLDVDRALAFLNRILEDLAAFSGMQMENMTRSPGWRLLDCGRRIERATYMAKLIRDLTVSGDPAAEGGLDLILELGDSSMTYRTRYLSSVQLPAVIDLLLVDETNPRSIAFQVEVIAEHLEALPHDRSSAVLSEEMHLVTAMASALKLTDVMQLCGRTNQRGVRKDMAAFVLKIENQTYRLSDALARRYFSHVSPTRSNSAGVVTP